MHWTAKVETTMYHHWFVMQPGSIRNDRVSSYIALISLISCIKSHCRDSACSLLHSQGTESCFFCLNFHAVDVKNRKGKRATVRAIIVARGRFKKEMSDSALECWLNFDVILF